jgi:hypothetical protein
MSWSGLDNSAESAELHTWKHLSWEGVRESTEVLALDLWTEIANSAVRRQPSPLTLARARPRGVWLSHHTSLVLMLHYM